MQKICRTSVFINLKSAFGFSSDYDFPLVEVLQIYLIYLNLFVLSDIVTGWKSEKVLKETPLKQHLVESRPNNDQ